MTFNHTLSPVVHGDSQSKDSPPIDFLTDIVALVKQMDNSIFAPNTEVHDVFNGITGWQGEKLSPEWFIHRKAVMLEVLRVLGGFESTWNWNEGKDQSSHHENDEETESAGLWQISYNSRAFGNDLRLLIARWNILSGYDFQAITKLKKSFAVEYAVRLFRHTTQHNGPLKRGEVQTQLNFDAIEEFKQLLNEPI